VQVPVDICGNAVGLLGFANASCQGGAAAFLTASTAKLTSVVKDAGSRGTRRPLP
jgi:hypothetical protein